MYLKKTYSIILILGLSWVGLSAQINLKIGYVPAYSKFELNNEILEQYNNSSPGLEEGFQALHIFHGIELPKKQPHH